LAPLLLCYGCLEQQLLAFQAQEVPAQLRAASRNVPRWQPAWEEKTSLHIYSVLCTYGVIQN
jgi:hypothetical protein